MTNVNDDRARLTALLTKLDLSPEPVGAKGVRVVLDGVFATIGLYGDSTLSLTCSVKGDGQEWDLHRINAANNRVRFAKFSVDRGNLMLEADLVFRLESPDAIDQLRQALKVWRMALHELQVLVQELVPA